MKTTRKIVNDCFYKGRPLDYKQHKAIIEELNARDNLLDACKKVHDLSTYDELNGVAMIMLGNTIAKAEANHA